MRGACCWQFALRSLHYRHLESRPQTAKRISLVFPTAGPQFALKQNLCFRAKTRINSSPCLHVNVEVSHVITKEVLIGSKIVSELFNVEMHKLLQWMRPRNDRVKTKPSKMVIYRQRFHLFPKTKTTWKVSLNGPVIMNFGFLQRQAWRQFLLLLKAHFVAGNWILIEIKDHWLN